MQLNALKNNNKLGLYEIYEIPRCARNDSSILGVVREKRRFAIKGILKIIIVRIAASPSITIYLACHSEHSEESAVQFTISLKLD